MFPTPWTVTIHRHTYGERDGYGERADEYEDHSEPVYGWAPPTASDEPADQGRRAVVADLDLLVPPTFSAGPLDEITIHDGPDAGRYSIEGDLEDFNHGPFGFVPGGRVSLRRVKEVG